MENNEKSVKLRGGPRHTTTWVKILENGDVLVDYFDFSDEAESSFGNDVAYVVTIKAADKAKLLQLLTAEKPIESTQVGLDDTVLRIMDERFESYFPLMAWLKESGVEYEKKFDSWA